MARLSLSNLSITKWIVLLLAVATAIVVARASIADADHHLSAVVMDGAAITRTGPANSYSMVSRLYDQQSLEILARSNDSRWLLVEAGNGTSGWTNASSVQVDGSFDKLSVNNNPLPNAQNYPTAMTFQRLVSIRNAPDWNNPVVASLHKGREVILMAQSPEYEWLYVFDPLGQGWVSRSELLIEGFDVASLPVWNPSTSNHDALALADTGQPQANTIAGTPKDQVVRSDPDTQPQRATASVLTNRAAVYAGPGTSYNVIGELSERDRPILQARDETNTLVFVWTYRFDGWVLASNLQLSVDIESLPIWSRPMQNAYDVPTGRVAVANLNVRTEGSTDGEVIGQLLEGQRITILGANEAGTWVYHSSALGLGWSYAPLISLSQDIDTLPIR